MNGADRWEGSTPLISHLGTREKKIGKMALSVNVKFIKNDERFCAIIMIKIWLK